jgi:hypothetical protein
MAVIPAKAHCCPGKFLPYSPKCSIARHPGESRDPATCKSSKTLGPGFRRGDESVALISPVNVLAFDEMQILFLSKAYFPRTAVRESGNDEHK